MKCTAEENSVLPEITYAYNFLSLDLDKYNQCLLGLWYTENNVTVVKERIRMERLNSKEIQIFVETTQISSNNKTLQP